MKIEIKFSLYGTNSYITPRIMFVISQNGCSISDNVLDEGHHSKRIQNLNIPGEIWSE